MQPGQMPPTLSDLPKPGSAELDDTPSLQPHCCPVCGGQGKVSKPPWVPGDVYEWASTSAALYPCHACSGTGIVWAQIRKEV